MSAKEGDTILRVLGVDPAAAGPTGYGVIESDGRHCRALHYGAFRSESKRRNEFEGSTLRDIHALLCDLIEKFTPDVMAVESIFTSLNMKTALRLAEVRGVVLLTAAQHGLAVHSYAPRQVKASVAGHGHADKKQVQVMVRALLSMTEIPQPTDAADALAVALCHLQAELMRRRFGVPDSGLRTVSRALRVAPAVAASVTRKPSAGILSS